MTWPRRAAITRHAETDLLAADVLGECDMIAVCLARVPLSQFAHVAARAEGFSGAAHDHHADVVAGGNLIENRVEPDAQSGRDRVVDVWTVEGKGGDALGDIKQDRIAAHFAASLVGRAGTVSRGGVNSGIRTPRRSQLPPSTTSM